MKVSDSERELLISEMFTSDMKEDENGGHFYVEHGSIGNKIVHVFYADDKERGENNEI